MNNILTEKEYQKFILEILEKQNGYRIRKNVKYDRLFAMDKEMLFEFLNSTVIIGRSRVALTSTLPTVENLVNTASSAWAGRRSPQ